MTWKGISRQTDNAVTDHRISSSMGGPFQLVRHLMIMKLKISHKKDAENIR